MKQLNILFALVFTVTITNAQLIINELSQGPSGTKEYVEFLVTGTPVCGGANTVDLRGWIIDDNNSWHGTGSGTGIAGGHARFDSIAQWANVKIGSLILIFNDGDMNTTVSSLTIDTNDSNHDCVYIIPVSSSVIQKNVTLPLSNGSMSTYAVAGTTYTPTGNWICLGMANSADAFHTVSPANYATAYHAIGWGIDTTLLNVHFNSTQGGKMIYMANTVNNNPFNAANFIDTTTGSETPGAPNNSANATWIHSMNNNCQPLVAPTVSFNNPTPLTCGNTSTVLIASSTTTGVTFNWSNGAATANDTVTTGGTYHVTVSDAASVCSTIDSITIAASSGLTLSASSTGSACGVSNGSATVTVTTGTATGYNWSSGATTATAPNLAGGTYQVTVTGAGGCSATASVTVTATSNITLSTSSTTATCGNNNGSATVTLTTGTATGYNWNSGATTATAPNLPAGTYQVTVTGAGGCSATATVTVTASGSVTVTTSAIHTSCGNNNGSATVTLTSGTAIGYNWSTGGTTATISNLASGTYTVTVDGGAGCSATASVTVNPSGNTPVTIIPDKTIFCSGDSAQICAPAGYQSYTWNNGTTTNCVHAKQAGNYYVTVTDIANCTATSNHVSIFIYPLAPVSISVNGDTLKGYNSVTYQWFYNTVLIAGANTPIYIAHQPGSYTLQVSDSNGCTALSNPVVINATGINNISVEDEFAIYPNPLNSGKWNLITGNNLLGATIEIFDNNGRLIYKSQIANQKLEIQFDFAKGIYLLKINSGQNTFTRKLVRL